VWITNAPAPYRLTIFEELASSYEFTLVLAGGSVGEHRWEKPATASYEIASLRRRWHLALWHSDVILGKWQDPRVFGVAIFRRLLGLPSVAFYESIVASHRFRRGPVAWARGIFFRSVDAVLTVGAASTEAIVAMKVPAERIVTGHNAVDVSYFHDRSIQLRTSMGVQSGHHFLFVGRLIPLKNVETALRAWQQIRQEDDTLTIVGSGPLREQLELVVSQLELSGVICFLGYLEGPALVSQYARAHTLVLPSTKEVWGLVVNEALAAGLHVVVSDVAGVAMSVDGTRGVYVTSPDRQHLAGALEASRRDWRGPIANPEIPKHTQGQLAATVVEAVALVNSICAQRWPRRFMKLGRFRSCDDAQLERDEESEVRQRCYPYSNSAPAAVGVK